MNDVISPQCPACGMQIDLMFHYCPQCGKSLRELLLGISIIKQMYIYFVSILVPPFGLIYTFRYIRYPLMQVKIVGIVALVLTLVSLGIIVWVSIPFINQVQTAMTNFDTLYKSVGF